MKSSTLIASYLLKDTWSRWLEQPSSVLARLFVSAILVTVATVILVAYYLLERNLETRLENFGLNTVITREMMSPIDAEALPNNYRPNRLAPLASEGALYRFRQFYIRGQTPWLRDIMVMAYLPETLPALAPLLHTNTPLLVLSDSWPENVLIDVTFNKQSGTAVIRRPPPHLRPIVQQHVLLIPQGWNAEGERIGYMENSIFQRQTTNRPLSEFVKAIQLTYGSDNRTPQVQSPVGMIEELETLKSRQVKWRSAMAGMLGVVLALVFGAISVLEFRQNMYVTALLRSFGTPAKALYIRQWMENAILANLAALSAVLLLASFHGQLFKALGFPRDLLNLGINNPYFSTEILLIFVWVNIGAFLSSLAVGWGLRKPVGEILS